MEKKVVTIVGARPQFIKAAVVSRVIQAAQGLQEVMVHTGQHYDHGMSEIFFDELSIPKPAYNLSIGSGGHGAQTGLMLEGIEKVLLQENPDWVLIYGDTNSTLAGALAASKLHMPVAHVEAGLRSFNKKMPEEQNRIVADHLSDLLLTPTNVATENLAREGIVGARVLCVGDVMFDAALYARNVEASDYANPKRTEKPYVLATVHRAENTDVPARLQAIFEGLASVAKHMDVVLPLHPRTKKLLEANPGLKKSAEKLSIIEPVGYLEMAKLTVGAAIVVTDSGGVQKEAYFHKTPCVTLRDETEWVELVELGWNRLQPPTSSEAITSSVLAAIGTQGELGDGPYGDGKAGAKVVEALLRGV